MPHTQRRLSRRLRMIHMASVALAAAALVLAVWIFGFRSGVRQEATVVVNPGASVTSVARQLKEQGLIKGEKEFKVLVVGFGGRVRHGVYDIPQKAGAWRIARMIARGEVASTTVMIPEGLTVRQIVAVLDANRFLTGEACARDECARDGELFPDTYKVSKGTPRAAVIDLMKRKMSEIERNWVLAGRKRPSPLKDWNEVITLASIVQKETPRVSEMPRVASVYINRLRKGMRLQADPTVVYAITDGLGDMQGKPLYTGHLKTQHPHNTYTNSGLPPHPIANVGRAAIRAVLNPADTNYLFFVADGTGGHVFSRTLDEHNIRRAEWREIKRAKAEEEK